MSRPPIRPFPARGGRRAIYAPGYDPAVPGAADQRARSSATIALGILGPGGTLRRVKSGAAAA